MKRKQTKSQSRMFYVKGSLVQRELSAKLTEGFFCVEDYRFLQSLRHGKPCHLPLHKGGFVLVPLERGYVTNAWLAVQFKAHLCVACSIRAMPETEIPPVLRGGLLCACCRKLTKSKIKNNIKQRKIEQKQKNTKEICGFLLTNGGFDCIIHNRSRMLTEKKHIR